MHLWPSMRLRDSFKLGYLKNLEWNLHRMDSQKQRGNDQKLLDEPGSSNNGGGAKYLVICRDFLTILSCCFCCGDSLAIPPSPLHHYSERIL
ncbi:hypothetical protein HAX54_018647 [Datura stramonium]|uniref:Uncharacterized protein n=1 Tax=Datura stramonium TaxID=4076 RepID=A0ABS8Y6Z7_DATST|nr:hypothetical protein [Datura stramonium]